MLFRETW